MGGHGLRRDLKVHCVLVGDVAGEAEVVATPHHLVEQSGQREAVQYHRDAGRVLAQHGQRVLSRLPGVDNHGQAGAPGQVDVVHEDLTLHAVRPMVVVVVEPGLAHAHHPGCAVHPSIMAQSAAPIRPASCGWYPTVATTSGNCSQAPPSGAAAPGRCPTG